MSLTNERKIRNRIVVLRAERGLSQKEVADMLGREPSNDYFT